MQQLCRALLSPLLLFEKVFQPSERKLVDVGKLGEEQGRLTAFEMDDYKGIDLLPAMGELGGPDTTPDGSARL